MASGGIDNPLPKAKVVWHMATLGATGSHPLDLTAAGAKAIRLGEKLEGAEYAESLKRGGDGHVALFDNPDTAMFSLGQSTDQGWLSINAERAKALRPVQSTMSLYVRAFLEKTRGWGTLFFWDSIGLAVHESGMAIAFLGQKTLHGATLRELPLGTLDKETWLDLVIRIDGRQLEFFCNGILRNSIPLTNGLRAPFECSLTIGAFGSMPLPHPTHEPCLQGAKIDTIALWDGALADAQIAFLCGLDELSPRVEQEPASQAIATYNQFYDASQSKDLALCCQLEHSMREFMRQDPTRPIYHLTAPIGWIFDPSGACQFQGKYHVYSYRNIYALIRFNSHDHYVSDDLVHWRMWPTSPVADSAMDAHGIYLANHIIDDEGLPNVIYGGWTAGGEVGIRARSHDGMISYGAKRVVLPKYHDGHAWREGDTWYAITMRGTASQSPEGPEILIYSSADLDHWTERGVLFRAREHADNMSLMEFPYLFSTEAKDVLMSGCMPAGVLYWVGKFDRQSFRFIPDHPEGLRVDYANSFHCFNPSTVDAKGPNGAPRRIIMAMESRPKGVVQGLPWNGVHAMPRVLSLDGNHLRQDPLPEWEVLRGGHRSQTNVQVTAGGTGYVGAKGDALEIIAEFENHGATLFGMKVRVSKDGKTFLRVFYNAETNEYGVDGNLVMHSEIPFDNPRQGRGPSYIPAGQPVQMRIFLDKALVETFVNGQTCTTSLEDKNPLHDGLDLFSEGGAVTCTRLDIWEMKSGAQSYRSQMQP
jgi:beta-fructofuranosidase